MCNQSNLICVLQVSQNFFKLGTFASKYFKKWTSVIVFLDTEKIIFDAIVIDNEKLIYYEKEKRRKSWLNPGQPFISQPKWNVSG